MLYIHFRLSALRHPLYYWEPALIAFTLPDRSDHYNVHLSVHYQQYFWNGVFF